MSMSLLIPLRAQSMISYKEKERERVGCFSLVRSFVSFVDCVEVTRRRLEPFYQENNFDL